MRWLRFLDVDGTAVCTIDRLDGLDVTVSRWTDGEVAGAGHREDLPVRDDCWVWIDARHRGVGPGPYRWSYRVR